MAIKSAPFSFIKFDPLPDDVPTLDIGFVLPVAENHENAFQFASDDDRDTGSEIHVGICSVDCQLIAALGVSATMIAQHYVPNYALPAFPFFLNTVTFGDDSIQYNVMVNNMQELADILADFDIDMNLDDGSFYSDCPDCDFNITGGTTIGDSGSLLSGVDIFYGYGFVDLSGAGAVSTGDTDVCFRYCLLESDNTTIIACSTNTFKKTTDKSFTSLMQYSCNENAFDFYYNGTTYNKVRLPIHLNRPAYPKTRSVYRNSAGRNKVLSATVEKEYQLETDTMPEAFHEAMAIALSHDNISIENAYIREKKVLVIESENYSPKWPDGFHYEEAPATGKVKVATFGFTNNNCETAGADTGGGSGPTCVGVTYDDFSFPDAVVGEDYSFSFPLLGDGPFDFLGGKAKPDWMDINISGDEVDVTNNRAITSDDIGASIEVSFTVENCDGDNTALVFKEITVVTSNPGDTGRLVTVLNQTDDTLVIENDNSVSYTYPSGTNGTFRMPTANVLIVSITTSSPSVTFLQSLPSTVINTVGPAISNGDTCITDDLSITNYLRFEALT